MGMQGLHQKSAIAKRVINNVRSMIVNPEIISNHRVKRSFFTRQRKLPFASVVLLLLQKSLKSIQLHLNEFFTELWDGVHVGVPTASAWTQARAKLRHTFFIALNDEALLKSVYAPENAAGVERWRGHRLLAVDSSVIRLPSNKPMAKVFGWTRCENQSGVCGRVVQGRLSVIFDVLNNLVVDGALAEYTRGETTMAAEQFHRCQSGDVLLLDRGFCGYPTLAEAQAAGAHFVCRCPRQSFEPANKLFATNKAGVSLVTTLEACPAQKPALRKMGLPLELRVRFVTVRLKNGELEVLVSSLLDEKKYPTGLFLELYGKRWGVETFYQLVKGRLALEHFSGTTVEAIRQDVHATIFLSNLESVVTAGANQKLRDRAAEKSAEKPVQSQVKHSVAFHAIKSQIYDLLASDKPIFEVLAQLEELFLKTPLKTRTDRNPPRRPRKLLRSYTFQKYVAAIVF
jgi:hypothetical protein